jgi:nitroreductase/FMN reductase [NAD(P)H]
LTAGSARLEEALAKRFGERIRVPSDVACGRGLEALVSLASRRVHRTYDQRRVDDDLVHLLCACALSSPSKSDLQQRDIVIVRDPRLRAAIGDLVPAAPQVRSAPAFLVFCANGARLPAISALRDKPFPNDHLDLFFNPVGDAAIALMACVNAAEAVGLGTCPISEIRNQARAIDSLLQLPERVIPFAGLCLGWPKGDGQLAPRLSLGATVHVNRYVVHPLPAQVAEYDKRRRAHLPYEQQLDGERWDRADNYGWSEHKARQYAVEQRADFARYVREKGFKTA